MSKTYNYQVAGTFDVATTGNIDDLDFESCALIRMTNASLATIRGLKAGYPGQIVVIASVGAGQVNLSHQNTGDGTAANRLINFVTSGVTPLAAGVGTATLEYDGTTARWRLVSHCQGAAIAPTYAAGDFTANGGMAWGVDAGDLAGYEYYLEGRSLRLSWYSNNTSLTAPLSNILQIAIPNGYTAFNWVTNTTVWYVQNGGARAVGFAQVAPAGTVVQILKLDASNWAASTNLSDIAGALVFSVN
jgi:hypothetical protein